jgi:hypothetical protein
MEGRLAGARLITRSGRLRQLVVELEQLIELGLGFGLEFILGRELIFEFGLELEWDREQRPG